MNQNDKFHGAEFEVNAQAVTDEKLEGVTGGSEKSNDRSTCPYCNREILTDMLYYHIDICSKNPANTPAPYIPSDLYSQNS